MCISIHKYCDAIWRKYTPTTYNVLAATKTHARYTPTTYNVLAATTTHAMSRDNKTTTVNNFVATMQLLNPQWRDDKRLLLQATDYLKNNAFNGSSAPQIENGAPSSESISIGSVALELGVSPLSNAKATAIGKHVAKMYRDRHGESPSKHNQTIGGNVILVNSYTLRDKDLVEDAIKAMS